MMGRGNPTAGSVAAIALGGCLGAAARFLVEESIEPLEGWFPLATLLVNLIGAFVLGLFLEHLLLRGADVGARRTARLFFGTGLCGSFTTYGAMVSEGVGIASSGSLAQAVFYLGFSLCAGVALAALGMRCARALAAREGGIR